MKTVDKPSGDLNVTPISIVLADDHTLMREGTKKLLQEDPAFIVVGEARDGSETIVLCQQLRPNVLILDIAMKGLNGFTVAQTLLNEPELHINILVLTGYDQEAYVSAMLQMGVKGYWLKSASSHDIRQAVHTVALGKESLDPEIRQQLAENTTSTPSVTLLTQREKEVLQLLAQGRRNGEISQQLHISIKTVETHLTSLYQKLGVQSGAEAISTAQRQGILLNP
jgi:DNA-binding NarL/FixJ family response regulator